MENLKFQIFTNEQGLVTNLSLSGMLVVENSQHIKKELVGVVCRLHDSVEVEIGEVDNFDLSFIQLMVAFARQLKEKGTLFRIKWDLDEDQRLLLTHVGLSNELFMSD